MEFAIQINVGESPQEALESALETMQKHERGEKCVVSHLGVLNWEQFYALFSPHGLKVIESFVSRRNGDVEGNLCEWQPEDTKGVEIETVVKKLGDSVGVSLSPELLKGRQISIGTKVKIEEIGSDLVITVRGNRAPSLNKMLAQSELSAERHPDSVVFESSPPVGNEEI